MAKYYIRHVQELHNGPQTIYYQGNNVWTTEYEQKKSYAKKADAKLEIYDFGGEIVKDNLSS
jgi:hypothetical protein